MRFASQPNSISSSKTKKVKGEDEKNIRRRKRQTKGNDTILLAPLSMSYKKSKNNKQHPTSKGPKSNVFSHLSNPLSQTIQSYISFTRPHSWLPVTHSIAPRPDKRRKEMPRGKKKSPIHLPSYQKPHHKKPEQSKATPRHIINQLVHLHTHHHPSTKRTECSFPQRTTALLTDIEPTIPSSTQTLRINHRFRREYRFRPQFQRSPNTKHQINHQAKHRGVRTPEDRTYQSKFHQSKIQNHKPQRSPQINEHKRKRTSENKQIT